MLNLNGDIWHSEEWLYITVFLLQIIRNKKRRFNTGTSGRDTKTSTSEHTPLFNANKDVYSLAERRRKPQFVLDTLEEEFHESEDEIQTSSFLGVVNEFKYYCDPK